MAIWKANFEKWKNKSNLDERLHKQLMLMEQNPEQLEESFYKQLEFGTGGIRGIIGPGTNRLNKYTIRKAAEGLSQYIVEKGKVAKHRGVVIAYDCRHMSPEFAMEVAKTLGFHGIKSYVFESLRSTPELSFAVRYLHAFSGIMITASHNPPEYNGLKLYGEDGGQVTSQVGEDIVEKINAVENELEIPVANEGAVKESGLLSIIGKQVDDAYLRQLQTVVVNQTIIDEVAEDFTIVYTPLHGTGNRPVRDGLKKIGFDNVHVVAEQERMDPDFSTVASPNPEEHDAFALAIRDGEKVNADILIATDPDADRMGVAVKGSDGDYRVLTGNQVGALLLHYLITNKKKQNELPANALVLKTIVTSELGRDIATAHGVKTLDTLTGFKYISEKINEFNETGEYEFLLGYEESYGYLIKDFVRDKDAVQSCLLIAEVAASYKIKGMTLYDGLNDIFKQYGFYKEGLESVKLTGIDGAKKIKSILAGFREDPPTSIAGKRVMVIEDYEARIRKNVTEQQAEKITLPKSNVLKYILEDGAWVCARPSGTEPLIKFYFGVKEDTMEASSEMLAELKQDMMNRVDKLSEG